MAEYIEREKILDAISEQRRFYLHERDGETDMEKLYLLWGSDNALTTMEDIMSDIPAADVAPVRHGRWIEDERTYPGPGLKNNLCSACGEVAGAWKEGLEPGRKWAYCPNCGARMDQEEEA